MATLFMGVLFSVFASAYCGKYTVTDEVWFNVEIKDLDGKGFDYAGRFVVAVFGEAVPMTSLNFVSLARSYRRGRDKLWYRGTKIHRIVPDFIIQMGDITAKDGSGSTSIYGKKFNDEDFVLSHRSPGWVAMANHGPDTNGSQFYILLTKARWLDTKHVVFGKVIRGWDVIETISEVQASTETGEPEKEVHVIGCGVLDMEKKYDLSEEQLDSTEDI